LEHLWRTLFTGAMAVAMTLHAAASSPATAPAAASASGRSTRLSTAQVEQLISPIALYPDMLLAQILTAATYPLEVVQAARWRQASQNLSENELEDIMLVQAWDPAMKALTAAPQVLQMFNEKLEWTQQVGEAFLRQQEDVLRAIQMLRRRAEAEGNLQNTAQQKVAKTARSRTSGRSAARAQIITIEPTSPEVIYAPIYDPAVVYGPWPYPDYVPPFYWYPPDYVAADLIGFATGFVASPIWANVDWRRNKLFINVNRYNTFNRTRISSADVAQRLGGNRAVANRDGLRNRRDTGKGLAPSRADARAAAKTTGDTGARRDATGRKSAGARGVTGAKGGQRIASRQAPRQGAAQRMRPNEAARNRIGSGGRLAARPTGIPRFNASGGGPRFLGSGAGPRFPGIGGGPRFLGSGIGPRFGGFGGGPLGAGGGFRMGGGGGGHFGGGGFRRR